MYVYLRGKLLVVETNVPFALKYWSDRKAKNPNITWEMRK